MKNLHSNKIKCNDNKQMKITHIHVILFHETKNTHFIYTQKVENKPFETIHTCTCTCIYNS